MARNIPKIPVFCFVFHVYRINGLALGYHHDLGVLLVVWGLWWGPPGSQVGEITPPGPAEVGWDQNRVVGGDTVSWVPHTSHVFGDKEKLLIWAYCWMFGGSDGVPLGHQWVGWDRSRVVGGDTRPRLSCTTANNEKLWKIPTQSGSTPTLARQVHKKLRWVVLRYKIVLSTQITTRIFTVDTILQ